MTDRNFKIVEEKNIIFLKSVSFQKKRIFHKIYLRGICSIWNHVQGFASLSMDAVLSHITSVILFYR